MAVYGFGRCALNVISFRVTAFSLSAALYFSLEHQSKAEIWTVIPVRNHVSEPIIGKTVSSVSLFNECQSFPAPPLYAMDSVTYDPLYSSGPKLTISLCGARIDHYL